MQTPGNSFTGSFPSLTPLQRSMADVVSNLVTVKSWVQFARQQPQIQSLESAAQFAHQIVEHTAQLATTLQQYRQDLEQSLGVSKSATTIQRLQEIVSSAQAFAASIAERIQAARAEEYAEGIPFYVSQLASTVEAVETLQQHLFQIVSEIQPSAGNWTEQLQAAEQSARNREIYLAQYGGIDPAQIISQVKAGAYPFVAAGIITNYGEIVLFNTPATLCLDLVSTERVRDSNSYSFSLGDGTRSRFGSSVSYTMSREYFEPVDFGNLVVTTQRLSSVEASLLP